MLERTISRLFADLAAAGACHWDDAGWRRHWDAVAGLALPDLMRPAEAGGFGGGWPEMGMLCRALGSHGLALPVAEAVLTRHWLSRLGVAATDGLDSFALVEGTDATLSATPWGGVADRVLVIGSAQWRLMPVAAAAVTPGCNLAGDYRDLLCFAGVEPLAIGPVTADIGLFQAEAALMRAAQIGGAVDRMLSMCVTHANDRMQFGRPLARFQAIQQQVALLAGENAAVAAAVAGACQAMAAGDGLFEAAAAKWRASRAAALAVDIAIQVHGAIGITREFPLHHFTLRAQAWRGECGNERQWADRIGAMVLARPSGPVWHWLTARGDRVGRNMT